MRFVFGCFCIFRYLCGFTRVEKFGLAKGDGGEGEVAADEDHVGDTQGGQQVVEYVVHFPSISETFRMESLTFFSFSLEVRSNPGILVLVLGDGS